MIQPFFPQYSLLNIDLTRGFTVRLLFPLLLHHIFSRANKNFKLRKIDIQSLFV